MIAGRGPHGFEERATLAMGSQITLPALRVFARDLTQPRNVGGETREITFPTGPGKTTTLTGQQFLSSFSLPSFYFHVVTAHDILRMSGVDVGKRDYLGAN